MFKHTHWLFVMLLASCGGQAGTAGEPGGAAGTSGSSGVGGQDASSGSGGGAGTGADADTDGDAATDGHAGAAGQAGAGGDSGTPSITCGAVTCTGIEPIPGFPLAPCCPTGLVDTCGVDISLVGAQDPSPQCERANAPGNLDTSCPTTSVGGLVTLPGCCTPGGTCGFQADVAGLGCVDPAALGVTLEGGVQACQPQADGG